MGDKITAIESIDSRTQEITISEGDYFFSTMPVKELIAGMKNTAPPNVREIAAGLQYRDFITVGVLLNKMTPPGKTSNGQSQDILPDT